MSRKKYKAVFFDWDGTAVRSRKAPVDEAVRVMKPLLASGVRLVIVSGTTIENIAGGKLGGYFTVEERRNLYMGLGRGAFNYAFDREGSPYVFADCLPDKEKLLDIHRICFTIHERLLKEYDFPTDIVFTRPNYCKIDLMVETQRGDALFMQEDELSQLQDSLRQHRIEGGLKQLLEIAVEAGEAFGLKVAPTCDAKYLEVGISSKSDNVDLILSRLEEEAGIRAEECCFWGDEFVAVEEGIFGSDSFMRTGKTMAGDFFDVSEVNGTRPDGVQCVGGGVERFLDFLEEQAQ